MDTGPVLIMGEGRIHLDSEELDLTLRGYPKGVRLLRLEAPILVQGPLTHPLIHVAVKQSHFVLLDRVAPGTWTAPKLRRNTERRWPRGIRRAIVATKRHGIAG